MFPGQNVQHFADDIFKRIFLNENARIWIQIPSMLVSDGAIDNKLALVQEMAWRRTGDKPITRTNADPVFRRMYAALGSDTFTS